MNDFEILIPLLAILVGGTAIILPIAGLTARFALKPMVEAFARMKGMNGSESRVDYLERRIAVMEEQFQLLEREHARLVEESEFRRQLVGK